MGFRVTGEAKLNHITKEQRRGIAEGLPHHGGLAGEVAGEGRFTIRTALAGSSPNVTIVDSWRGHDMRAIDAGSIRHPVWGRWVRGLAPQRVTPGLLTKPVMRNQLRLRFAIGRDLDQLAREIAKET
jgi:hypothetical protein